MEPLRELEHLLRPAGGGVYLVSTGKAEQEELQRSLYGLPPSADEAAIRGRWRDVLARISSAKAVLLAIPSDVGAGFLRGANMGPAGIRSALYSDKSFVKGMESRGIVDIGDVFVVPQLLHDEMLSAQQIRRTQAAIYGDVPEAERSRLPVSPLSMAERALDLVFALNPNVRPVLLGGDHSCAWPMSAALARHMKEPWAIVQIDAHTDMLEERLGVKYCFGTWSYHASRLFDRPDKMVQVGIRATRHERAHWEGKYGIRQFWAEDCVEDPNGALDRIVEHVKSIGAKCIYFSNDIDGTDSKWADATGTPEDQGLTPDFVATLIERLGKEVGLCAGDVMEVAPPIERTQGGRERTLELAVRYVKATLDALK